MSQFDWHTDDEKSWDERPQPATPPPHPRRKRPYPLLIFIFLALAVAAVVVTRQVNQQVESATRTVQEDVLATHNLLRTAVARQDIEVFRSILSGRQPAWTASQEMLLRGNLLRDRSFMAWQQTGELTPQLTLENLETLSNTVKMDLSPDLNTATLSQTQEYRVMMPSGVTETITLLHTAVYRRGSQRWLYSPPDDEFWGNWITRNTASLTLSYTERDEATAGRLAGDLEVLLRRLCRMNGIACPADLRVNLRLDNDPASLLAAQDEETVLTSDLRLNLPTPTLLGAPVGERGYEALYRAYGGWVVTAVLADLTGWQCCHHAPIFQVFADYILNQMDLRPWPVNVAAHAEVLSQNLSFNDLQVFWNRHTLEPPQSEELRILYAGVDFLLQTYPLIDAVSWLEKLESRGSMLTWLRSAFGEQSYFGSDAVLLDVLDEEWWQFSYTQTLLAQQQATLPIPFPDQSLQLLCLPNGNYDENTISTFWHYDLPDETWTEILTRTGYSLVLPFPFTDDADWLLQSFSFGGDDEWHTEIWRNGQFVAQPAMGALSLSLGQTDPSGRYLMIYSGEQDDESPHEALVDLHHCDSQACELLEITGEPTWSPDSQNTLIVETDLFSNSGSYVVGEAIMFFDAGWTPTSKALYLGDGQAHYDSSEAPIGEGYSPFWLDNTTYGYLRVVESGDGREVVLGDLASGETRIALTLDDLLPLAPGDISAPSAIRHVLTHPAQPGMLFLVATDALGHRAYVFSYDVATEAVALRLAFSGQPFFAIGFSPDGRWLTLAATDEASSNFSADTGWLSLHNIATGKTLRYVTQLTQIIISPRFDWSANSQWITFSVHNRLIGLVAPDYEYQWVLAHEKGYCASQNWINREK